MMKFLAFSLVLAASFPASARQANEPDVGGIESEIERYQMQTRRGAFEEQLWQEDLSERGFMNVVKTMSPEQLEYLAPVLYKFSNFSDRVLNAPEFKQFKGKKPSRIAPQMKEAAEKYLDFLSPEFYVLLMPEGFLEPVEFELGDVDISGPPSIMIVSPQMEPERVALLVDPHGSQVERQALALPFGFAQQGSETILPVNTARSKIVTEDSPVSDADVLSFSASLSKLRSLPSVATKPYAPDSHPLPEDACRSYLAAVKENPKASEKFAAILAEEKFDEPSWLNMCLRGARAVFFAQFNPERLRRFFVDRVSVREFTEENAWKVEEEQKAAVAKFKKMYERMVFNPEDFNRMYPYTESLSRALRTLPDYDSSLELKEEKEE